MLKHGHSDATVLKGRCHSFILLSVLMPKPGGPFRFLMPKPGPFLMPELSFYCLQSISLSLSSCAASNSTTYVCCRVGPTSIDKPTEELFRLEGRKTIAGTNGITHVTQLKRGQANSIFVPPVQESGSRAHGADRAENGEGCRRSALKY